jgi:hypothetical protein
VVLARPASAPLARWAKADAASAVAAIRWSAKLTRA